MFALVLIGLMVIFSYGVGNVSAANASTIYVNGSSGNDTWNGQIAVWNGTTGPKATITNATGTVDNNGTVYIADRTYNESNITININMTIIGENQIGTIINANRQGDIFNINPGVTLTLENLTLKNGYAINGGAINNQGELILKECILQNNTASNYGGAVDNDGVNGKATATVNNNTFINNNAQDGGAFINNGDHGKAIASITNNRFLNNSSIYVGGAVFNSGDFGYAISNINNNTFSNNHAKGYYGSGGAIDNAGDYGNATATISSNTFLNNSATYVGGSIEDTGFYGNVTAFVNNNTFSNSNAQDGGAIINDGDHGNDITTTVNNNTFLNNYATNGGAISDAGDYGNVTATIMNNKLSNNTATDGGGVNNSCDYGNVTATLTNNTFLNNTATDGGAIINDGDHGNLVTVTINNNTLLNNTATEYGGADDNTGDYGNVKVNITNCTMENNTAVEGGAIENDGDYSNATAIITNCTIENNTATHYGGAIDDEGDYGTVIATITNNALLTNTASDGGAINNAGDYGNTTVTIHNNTLLNNNAIDSGGAFSNTGGDGYASATLNYNRIVDNRGIDVYELNGQVNAEDNWWGTNFNDTNPESAGMTNFPVNTWIVLNITANPSTINMGGNSTLTANLLYNNNNTQINGNLPDGIPVNFETTMGNVNPINTTIQNNTARTLFIPNTLGYALISAIVDNQTVSTLVQSKNLISTNTTVNSTNGYANHTVTLTAVLTAADNSIIKEGNVTFTVDNAPSVTTPVINGIASYTWTIPSTWTPGNYKILADYFGTTNYEASNNTNILNVLILPPSVIKTDPVNNSVNVGVNNVIKITFSEPIKAGNMWIELKNSTGTVKSFKTTILGNILSIKPNSLLTAGTKFIVILHSNSITDLKGNGFVGPYTTKFTTANIITPKVISTIPSNQKTGFSRTEIITIKFNENIKKSTQWSNIQMKNLTTGKKVSITQQIKGNTLYIKMVFLRYAYNWYQITIPEAAIIDNNGHNLQANYTFKFKTGK